MFIGCGLRDLVPLVGSLSVTVTVHVYTGGPSAVVSLLGYFLVVLFVGSLCGIVSGPVCEVQWSLVTYMIFIYKDAQSHEHKIHCTIPFSAYATNFSFNAVKLQGKLKTSREP